MLDTEPFRVLVVDDEPEVRLATVRALQKDNYELWDASDGSQALEMVAVKQPDLVLLDVVMGELDGFEICRRIKRSPHAEAPFVVLASNRRVFPADRIEGLSTGADGYLSRPISNRELRAQVRAFERIVRASRIRGLAHGRRATLDARSAYPHEASDAAELREEVRRMSERLLEKDKQLADRAVALRVLVEELHAERHRLEERFVANLRNCVQPILRRLLARGEDVQPAHAALLEQQIDAVADSFGRRLDDPKFGLSGREKEICALIRAGQSSKDIADLLHLSVYTVNSHRNRIRRKLGLSDRLPLAEGLRRLARQAAPAES